MASPSGRSNLLAWLIASLPSGGFFVFACGMAAIPPPGALFYAGSRLSVHGARDKMLTDSYNRVHTYLRLSVTDRCNFRCRYCMPPQGVKLTDRDGILRPEEIVSIARTFAEMGVRKIRITGGEPLLRRGLDAILTGLAKIRPKLDLAITTNGFYLLSWLHRLTVAGVRHVNISLDTFTRDRFAKITGVDAWHGVRDGIKTALKHPQIEKVKLNVVLQRGVNDDEIADFAQLTVRYPLDVRFIEMMPVGETPWKESEWISGEEALERIPGLKEIPNDEAIAGPARLYRLPGALGRIGIISGLSCPACSGCNRLRLTARGVLLRCLFDPAGMDLRDALRSDWHPQGIARAIQVFLSGKGEIGRPQARDRLHGYSPCLLQVGG